jgi:hypothetical protein
VERVTVTQAVTVTGAVTKTVPEAVTKTVTPMGEGQGTDHEQTREQHRMKHPRLLRPQSEKLSTAVQITGFDGYHDNKGAAWKAGRYSNRMMPGHRDPACWILRVSDDGAATAGATFRLLAECAGLGG